MVLVSVFGDFHSSILPVYVNLKDKISKHIIIYDDLKSDVKEARNIIKGLKAFNNKYKLKIKTFSHCIDEDSYEAIINSIKFIKKHTNDYKNVFINTTDGLSNINAIIALKLVPLGVNLLSYDRYDNEVNVIKNGTMDTYKLDKSITIQDHFLLRNIKVANFADKKDIKRYKNEIIKLFEVELNEFKSFAKYVQNEKFPTLNNKKFKKVNKIIKNFKLKDLKSNQGFITGTLFEFYIYLKIEKLDFDDIEVGVTVEKYIDETNFIPNEFDILIMKNNHLHMIECKFTKNIKLDTIVYKYMGLRGLLDDDGKICIVTGHKNPHNFKNSKNPVEYLPYKRAFENKILLRGNPLKDMDNFISEIKRYFEI